MSLTFKNYCFCPWVFKPNYWYLEIKLPKPKSRMFLFKGLKIKITKKCSRCKIEKALDFFNRCKKKEYGRHHLCKACMKEYRKNYYTANRKKIKATHVEYRKENREKYLETKRAYNKKVLALKHLKTIRLDFPARQEISFFRSCLGAKEIAALAN